METAIDTYWKRRLENCREALIKSNFEAFVARDPAHAGDLFFDQVLPGLPVKTVSWGDSLSLLATGILDRFRRAPDLDLIETFAERVSREEIIERRRQALLADLFFTGANAVTASGCLVNLDMVGNRTAGITFGPRNVVIIVGRNKIVPDLDAARRRIKALAAPMNAIRHASRTPCARNAVCRDCKSPDRICNVWSVVEKSYPPGRIKVILINQDLGL